MDKFQPKGPTQDDHQKNNQSHPQVHGVHPRQMGRTMGRSMGRSMSRLGSPTPKPIGQKPSATSSESSELANKNQLSTPKEMPAERVIPQIQESVGKGGVNCKEDVEIVQYYLQEAGLLTELDIIPEDAGAALEEAQLPNLIAAIYTFQTEVLHWPNTDGNIGGPASKTLAALKTTTPDQAKAKMEKYPAIKARREAEAAAEAKVAAELKKQQEKAAATLKAKQAAEKKEKERVEQLKGESDSPENAQKFISEYPNKLALANRMSEFVTYKPSLVNTVLNELGRTERDNLTFALMKRLSDSELANTDRDLLVSMKSSLEAWFVSYNSGEYEKPIKRLDNILGIAGQKDQVKDQEMVEVLQEGIDTPELAPYASQLDNIFEKSNVYGLKASAKKVNKYTTCNVTSLAMALRSLAPEIEVRDTLLVQLQEGGWSEEEVKIKGNYDLEDLIIYRFQQLGVEYWQSIMRQKDENFSFGKGSGSMLPHQYAYCLGEMGRLIICDLEASVGEVKTSNPLDNIKDFYIQDLGCKLEVGEEIILSTNLTGGHIVYLESVTEEGVIIEDPYGLNIGKKSVYLRNGYDSKHYRMKSALADLSNSKIDERLKYNPSVKKHLKKIKKDEVGIFSQKLGEKNFYKWAEVKEFNIGKWYLVLGRSK